jgi:hypothetical protein
MDELVLERRLAEKRHCASSDNATRARPFSIPQATPLAFLASRHYISRKEAPVGSPGVAGRRWIMDRTA